MAINPSTTDPAAHDGKDEKELGFNPESPDVSDPNVDPTHPARTSNDPVPTPQIRGGKDDGDKPGRGAE